MSRYIVTTTMQPTVEIEVGERELGSLRTQGILHSERPVKGKSEDTKGVKTDGRSAGS